MSAEAIEARFLLLESLVRELKEKNIHLRRRPFYWQKRTLHWNSS